MGDSHPPFVFRNGRQLTLIGFVGPIMNPINDKE